MGHVIDGIDEYMKGRDSAKISDIQDFIERESNTRPSYTAIIISVRRLYKFGVKLQTLNGEVRRIK